MVQESWDSYVRDPACNACYIYLNNSRGADPLNITGFKESIIKLLVGKLKKTKTVQVSKPTFINPHWSNFPREKQTLLMSSSLVVARTQPKKKMKKYVRIMSRSTCVC